jgi:hypothetical protein
MELKRQFHGGRKSELEEQEAFRREERKGMEKMLQSIYKISKVEWTGNFHMVSCYMGP